MDKASFKTNINCGNCIKAVSNFIKDVEGLETWEVNTDHPDKILTVKGTASKEAIVAAVMEAGFDITELPSTSK